MTIQPPEDWQPMPRELREWFWVPATPHVSTHRNTRFIKEVQKLLDDKIVEVVFRVKNHRYPDPENRYWWRIRQADLFEKVKA